MSKSKSDTQKVKSSRGAPKKANAIDIQTRLDKYELETAKFDAKVINHISELRNVIFDMALGIDKTASPTNRKSSAEYLIKYVEEKYDQDVIERRNKKGNGAEGDGDYVAPTTSTSEDNGGATLSLIDMTYDDAAEG
tara:strand:+ start:1308 stop:1718 length:411 start_codon:yes stop_codon:yes gene_type:complete